VRTDFTLEQLADPDLAESEKILRTCTHCGFCTATCPTYVLLGDELDSPRGRIYLIKDMIAGSGEVTADTVKHDDLSVGRQLHAPRRPCAALDRRKSPP
jgi:glycolate dehydrogenase iron-sulfur subunit